MIDIHAHILPGIDDGPRDWQETLDMCDIAVKDGIHLIVATPHVKRGMYTPAREIIFSRVAELNTRLRPPCCLPPALTILPGADNAFDSDIPEQIEQEKALFIAHPIGGDASSSSPTPLADSSSPIATLHEPRAMSKGLRAKSHEHGVAPSSLPPAKIFHYILLELPDYFLFPQVKNLIQQLRKKNIIPVLSHPERIAMIRRNYNLLREFIQAGALSQITAMSVTGEFGKEIKKFTRTLIKKNLAHIIATDTHSTHRRPPVLSRAVSEAADLIGSDKAELMVGGIPRAIIDGKEVNIT